MAFINPTKTKKKTYKLLFSHDNNYCSMPTYLYDSASNKLTSFSTDTNFRLKDKSNSMLSVFEEINRQKQQGEQNNTDILEINLSQTIYPREENAFLNGVVKRENYLFSWRDSATNRYNQVSSSQLDSTTISYFNTNPSQRLFSKWSLDCFGTSAPPIYQGELMFKPDYGTYNILHARYGRSLDRVCTPDNSVDRKSTRLNSSHT